MPWLLCRVRIENNYIIDNYTRCIYFNLHTCYNSARTHDKVVKCDQIHKCITKIFQIKYIIQYVCIIILVVWYMRIFMTLPYIHVLC